jgi:hypothetical protein
MNLENYIVFRLDYTLQANVLLGPIREKKEDNVLFCVFSCY